MRRTRRGLQGVLKSAAYLPPGKDSVGMEVGMGTCDRDYDPDKTPSPPRQSQTLWGVTLMSSGISPRLWRTQRRADPGLYFGPQASLGVNNSLSWGLGGLKQVGTHRSACSQGRSSHS